MARLVIAILATILLGLSQARPAAAVCANMCDCIGAAKDFDALANDKLVVSFGKVSVSGSAYRVETDVDGAVCGNLDTLVGAADEAETSVGDVVGRSGPGTTAIKFKGVRVYGELDPGVTVNGDVATGGGSVVNASLAIIEGNPDPDVSGNHPLVGSCRQGLSDLQTNSTELATLPATASIGVVVAKGGEEDVTVITTQPGVNIIHSDGIKVTPKHVSGYPEGSELTIDMDANATMVVINTPKLSVGKQCQITLTGPGADPQHVVINVTSKSGVKLSQESNVEVAILAPQSTVTALAAAEVSNLYGNKVTIKGAAVSGNFGPPCSPSGAFLESDGSLF